MPTVAAIDLDPKVLPEPSAPLSELPRYAADKFGDVPFLSDTPWPTYDRPVTTFTEFADAIDDDADRLWAAGIRSGDVVVVLQRNHIEVQAVMCAAGKIGALPALLHAAMDIGEMLESIAKLDRPYVLVDGHGLSRIAASRHALAGLSRRVLSLTETDLPWVAPALDRQPHTPHPRTEDEWFVVTHSSGTTGSPKLAAHSTRSLFGMVIPQILIMRTQYDSHDMSAKHLSFVHARTLAGTLACLEVAIPILSIADPGPEDVKRLLLEHRPTALETHPNMFIHWEPLATDPDRPFGQVQRFISTFDAIHPRTVRILLEGSDQPDAHYLQAYGQTESGPVCMRIVTRAEADSYNARNVGFTGAGNQMRVVDEAGEQVAPGDIGYIQTKSTGRMRGYLNADTPMIPDDEWWPMCDVGRLLPDGSLELLDRIVDQVEGTESLLVKEDELLDRLPELVELVLVQDENAGELVAVACPRPGAQCSPERFKGAAAEVGLGPVRVLFWDWEALPLTGTYKVRRGVLRQRVTSRLCG